MGKPEKILTQFNEHSQARCNHNCNSSFSKHLLENEHPTHTAGNTTEILYDMGKGSHLNTIGKYYI